MKFLYLDGLKKLVGTLTGDENVYLGIRPSGFHSGNELALVVYPFLLCQYFFKRKNIDPKFNFYLFLNDWEQDALDGIDPKTLPFNIWPQNTTLQYIDKIFPRNPSIEFWSEFIIKKVSTIKEKFPQVNIIPVKNSEMKNTSEMKKYIIKTIENPKLLGDIFTKHSQFNVLSKNQQYAIAVCPHCFFSKGKSSYIQNEDTIVHSCDNCKKVSKGLYKEFDYWFYHKPLAVPRIELFNIDLCITGGDHKEESDYEIRKSLIKGMDAKVRNFKTLYAPITIAPNGQKMGKSKNNTCSIPFELLLKKAQSSNGSKITLG